MNDHMDTQKINYFEKIEHPKHQEFILAQNHCVLCGTALQLKHVADQVESQIKEEAYCPECEIKTRAKIFSLH